MAQKKSFHVVIAPDQQVEYSNRQRFPRLGLSYEQFKLDFLKKFYGIKALTQTKMVCWLNSKEDTQHFSVGFLVHGILGLKSNYYPISARVGYFNETWVEYLFESLPQEVDQAIGNYLDAIFSNLIFKPAYLFERSNICFCGPLGIGFLLKKGWDGSVQKMNFFMDHDYLQWDQEKGLSTGKITYLEGYQEYQGIYRIEVLALSDDHKINLVKLKTLKSVILNSNLADEIKNWCLKKLFSI